MTKDKALHAWFSDFMVSFPLTSVPEDVLFPYLTYEPVFDTWDSGEVGLAVNLWFYTESEAFPNAKALELSRRIGPGGVFVKCDGGYIWIKRGTPFCQSLRDDASPDIKRRYINLSVEYLTEN